MTLAWPQIIYIVLSVAALWVAVDDHGKPQTGTHNAWHAFAATAVSWLLLWLGGFFG